MSAWFEEYLAAWNSRDVERVLSWMTDDIVYEDTTLGHVATGTDQMRRFAETFANVPEARFEFVTGFDDGVTFAMEWVMHPMELRGATLGSLRSGRVCAHRDYWDGAQFHPDQN